jgi:hypothetical protein
MASGVYETRPLKARRHRRTREQLDRLDSELIELVREFQPITIRGVFYRAEVRGLIPKTEHGYDVVQRRLLKLRREGRLPYVWITDGVRTVMGHERYSDVEEFAEEVRQLYRRDYWRNWPEAVFIWIEKDALSGVIAPTVLDWGLDLWISRGLSSESYLFRAGRMIARSRKPTWVYVLADFDPSGLLISEKVAEILPGFTDNVPVRVRRLALDHAQVAEMQLPTRPVKHSDSRARKFVAKYGDRCAELDAIPPPVLRQMVDEVISTHADRFEIERLKLIEADERARFRITLDEEAQR